MNAFSKVRPPAASRPTLLRRTVLPGVVTLLLTLFHTQVNAGEAVRVTGTDGAAQAWTAARLREDLASDLKPVEFTGKGQKHTSNSVPLLALLRAAGIPVSLNMDPKADPQVKNFNLRLVVVVQGGDGYTATFSLGELLPEVGGREAWLALDEDGKPLPERDGVVKLIVPTDQKPGRWVRNVVSVTVVNPAVNPAARSPG